MTEEKTLEERAAQFETKVDELVKRLELTETTTCEAFGRMRYILDMEHDTVVKEYKEQVASTRKELKERGYDLEFVDAFVREKLIEKGYKPEEIYDAIQI